MDFALLLIQSATVVTLMTSLIKAIPVEWTSKYPAYINGALSLICAAIVAAPAFTLISIANFIAFALFTAVLAGLAYNQFTSRLKTESL